MEQLTANIESNRAGSINGHSGATAQSNIPVIELVGLPESIIVVKETCVELSYDITTGEYQIGLSQPVSST